jgi:hypothetical protein
VKRVFGIILFGIGITAAVFAAGLRFYVTPTALNIPYDLDRSTTIAEAADGKMINTDTDDPDNVQALLTGTPDYLLSVPLRSYTWVVPQPGLTKDKLKGDLVGTAVIWTVYDSMGPIAGGDPLTASRTDLVLDRKSGAIVPWSADTGVAQYPDEGHSYKLPFDAQQTTYPYWDGTLGKTLDMSYVATETVEGLEAYRYEQAKVESEVDAVGMGLLTAEQFGLLQAVIGEGSGEVYYSVERTLFVEPVTGQYLDVNQTISFEFRGGNGENRTLLSGSFKYTDETKANTLDGVKTNRDLIVLVQQTLPVYAGGGGVLLFLVGIVLIVLGGKKKEPAAPAPTETPTPTPAA